jgi:hypothetical protein
LQVVFSRVEQLVDDGRAARSRTDRAFVHGRILPRGARGLDTSILEGVECGAFF